MIAELQADVTAIGTLYPSLDLDISRPGTPPAKPRP